jgi:DNA-binding transcriptional MerR regulator
VSDDDRGLSIEELAERAGVPVRTIRFYVAEGLLPGPGARGKAAAYGTEHLQRLLLIRRLVEQRVPLVEIRERLAGLTLEEVGALLAQEEEQAAHLQQKADAESPAEYLRALLHRARSARERPGAAPAPSLTRPGVPLHGAPAPPQLGPEERPLPSRQAEVWQRWPLAPGVELHVRADVVRRYHTILERLRATAAALFGRSEPPS